MQNSSSIGPRQGLLLALERTPSRIELAKDSAGVGVIGICVPLDLIAMCPASSS